MYINGRLRESIDSILHDFKDLKLYRVITDNLNSLEIWDGEALIEAFEYSEEGDLDFDLDLLKGRI